MRTIARVVTSSFHSRWHMLIWFSFSLLQSSGNVKTGNLSTEWPFQHFVMPLRMLLVCGIKTVPNFQMLQRTFFCITPKGSKCRSFGQHHANKQWTLHPLTDLKRWVGYNIYLLFCKEVWSILTFKSPVNTHSLVVRFKSQCYIQNVWTSCLKTSHTMRSF